MTQFDELHFFVDESGNLQEQLKRDVRLVGGLLVFGDYHPREERGLTDILVKNMERVGGEFPQSYHFGNHEHCKLPEDAKRQLCWKLSGDIKNWAGNNHEVYGIHVVHEQDIFDGTSRILAERSFDNRYISMLWALVEHVVFVDQRVADRLSPRATLHLHIANRKFIFNTRDVHVTELEALGYKPEIPRKGRKLPGDMEVPTTISGPEVATMMRMAQRQRWGSDSIELKSVEVVPIDYKYRGNRTPAGLYLADLYLSAIRPRYADWLQPYKTAPVPTFCGVKYGPWMESLARMQAGLAQGSLDQYVAGAMSYCSQAEHCDLSGFTEITKRQNETATPFLQQGLSRLVVMLEDAATTVDRPGGAEAGLAMAEHASQLMHTAGLSDLRAETLLCQTRLSYANHTGDTEAARWCWDEFLQLEDRLHTLGAEGLRLMAAIRNRRAVSLTDRFFYDEAHEVLSHVVVERESFIQKLANHYGVSVEEMPAQQLAECVGSLGQVNAFLGTAERRREADSHFHRAIGLFQNADDIERQYVYLGHLACDIGENGKHLWDEVLNHLPELQTEQPEFESGSQYKLALWLKGRLVFGDSDATVRFVDSLNVGRLLSRFRADEQQLHPFGLIHQTLAMMYSEAWRSTGREPLAAHASQRYTEAAKVMKHGSGVLRLLGHLADVRHRIFRLEVTPGGKNSLAKFKLAFRAATGVISESLNACVSDDENREPTTDWFGCLEVDNQASNVERAKVLVSRIRFNYW